MDVDPFLESPNVFTPGKLYRISNLLITELFHSNILNMNVCSLCARSFIHIHISVLDTDKLKKKCVADLKTFWVYEKQTSGV